MVFSIISDDLKTKLEQERVRLTENRAEIIAQATEEVDRAIQSLTALLGQVNSNGASSAPASQPKAAATAPATAPERKSRVKAKPAVVKEKAAAKPKAAAPAKPAKPAAKPKAAATSSSDAGGPTLKKSYQGMKLADAVHSVLKDSPTQAFTTDDVIERLYASYNPEIHRKVRREVAFALGRGSYQQTFEKIQNDPAQYKLR